MKLLQVPTVLLDQRIKEELEINPALEEGDYDLADDPAQEAPEPADSFDQEGDGEREEASFEEEDYVQDYLGEEDGYRAWNDANQTEEEDRQLPIAGENSFHEFLEQQMGMLDFQNEREEAIARQLIGSIDEDGYLRRDPASV
ncbi:MAG: hypothetical protein ACKOA4_01030 [Haliscomenobacter sp.]